MTVQLLQGDCLEVMRGMDDNSVDAVVTDPPYGLKFMGKKWDYDVPSVEVWQEVLRVLKPGGHLLSFGGTRTYHRMVVNIEDAGFEPRDMLQYLYGSGFPKSYNIGKGIEKYIKTGNASWNGTGDSSNGALGYSKLQNEQGYRPDDYSNRHKNKMKITTPEAQQWDGWGTALKPAVEPICLARKPLAERTIAGNVLEWGTGGINVDGCRINVDGCRIAHNEPIKIMKAQAGGNKVYGQAGRYEDTTELKPSGRFPANVILDEEAGRLLDEMSGVSKSPSGFSYRHAGENRAMSGANTERGISPNGHGDSGGASRFFYTAKSSRRERNAGLEGINHHPTVKPISLMRYLCLLITPPGGVILDPYMGSGSTGCGAVMEGFSFIGIEREAEYLEIARRRVEYWQAEAQQQPTLL